MKVQWKRKHLRLLAKARGVIGYDRRRKAAGRTQGGSNALHDNSGPSISRLFEEVFKDEMRENNRFNRRRT